MSRKRELYIEVEAAGRVFTFEDSKLQLTGSDAAVTDAYFATKKILYEEKESDDVFTFTFKDIKKTLRSPKTSAQKTATANAIRAKLKFSDNKYTDNKKIIAAFVDDKGVAKDNFTAKDTITIKALRKEEKTYYIKKSFGSMGNQMYLVVETQKLNAKKVKIKIHESESNVSKKITDKEEKKLKLLKSTEDVLPVKVFAKKEDKTTDTEATGWIEIDIETVKAKDADGGFYISEDNTTEKEVGIKKIQLRPKEDKDFKEWAEKLYIRYDESEEGKTAKATRDAETFTTLTKDDNLTAISYPKKISGPNLVNIGEEAVYILEEYTSTNATTADKHNIEWSLFVHGVDTNATTINSKSKDKLYTYAKMELVDITTTTGKDGTQVVTGGKNKLTIVFDKALIGKKVQIEPFRGSPDLSNKEYYVKITAIHNYKVTDEDISKLWLQTQCDDCEEEKKEKEFLNGRFFKLKTSCYCDRDMTEKEVKDIIVALRKSESSVYTGENKEKLFWKENFNLPSSEKTFKKLTEQLNNVFNNYDINTCKRKMHFLAQVYHETDRLRTLKEYATTGSYAPYVGRGLMQLTWEINYKRYKSYSGKDCITNKEIIANNLENAFDSAGWFWKQGKGLTIGSAWVPPSSAPNYVTSKNPNYNKEIISYTEGNKTKTYGTLDLNLIADDDFVDVISYLVNGGSNGLTERQEYLKELKKIFEYETKCKNKM